MLMENLRNNARSAGIMILFGIIIIVFIFSFGPASTGCRSGAVKPGGDYVAKVNGEKISRKNFEVAYARHLQDLQRRAGGQESITRELADSLGFGGRVLDQLIDQELLLQSAKADGLVVSDDEIAEELSKVDAFKVNGVFSNEAYKSVVERQLGMMTWQFEESLRRDLTLQKKISGIQAAVRVSDDEIAAEFAREKELYALSVIRISADDQKATLEPPTASAIDAFAKEHADDVKARYDGAKDRYNQSKQVHARHILVKTGGSVTVEQATAKIQGIKDRVVKGEDFAEIAKAESEDPGSKVKGGDLGTFGEGVMVPEFQAAAFAMKAGEISDPVVTKFGVHLIKVEEVIDAKTVSLDEATPSIARELLIDQMAKDKAKAIAQGLVDQLKAGKAMADLGKSDEPADPVEAPAAEGEAAPAAEGDAVATAEAATDAAAAPAEAPAPAAPKYEVESTGDFRILGNFIPVVGVSEQLAADLPTMAVGPASKVYETSDAMVVANLDKHDTPDMTQLTDDVKAGYRERLTVRRTDEALKSALAALRAAAKIEKDTTIGGLHLEALGAN